jgi:hypothetical protein
MATNFDGINLVITLNAGVTNYDWGSIYKEWKQWQLSGHGNRGYPPAFRTTGGDSLNALLDQGAYYFLRNDLGWRIRPAEEDASHYPSGNLIPQDSNLPMLLPTIGAYTVGIFGLQPITQGISDDLTEGLAAITYIGKEGVGIYVDPLNVSGNAIDSNLFPAGNVKNPCLTETNLEALDNDLGFRNVYVKSNFTLTQDYSHGHVFFNDNPQTVAIVCGDSETYPDKNVYGCKFQDAYITGELDSANIIWECIVGSIQSANGFIYQSTLIGPIVVSDNISIERCWIAPTAPAQECVIDFDGIAKTVIMSQWSAGRIICKNMVTGSFLGIAGTGGRVIPDVSNTGGTVVFAGAIDVDNTYGDNLDLLQDSSIARQVLDKAIEGNYSVEDMLRIMGAAIAGKTNKVGSNRTFRDLNDLKDRIVATVTDTGDRTAVVLDVA